MRFSFPWFAFRSAPPRIDGYRSASRLFGSQHLWGRSASGTFQPEGHMKQSQILGMLNMKIVVSVAFLTMFTPSSSFAFSVTGGLNYNLQVLNTPPAKTAATVISVQTTPDGAETRMPLETYPVPVERGALGVTLGRIEYGVAIGGIRSYKTTIKVSVMDTALGETDCTFVFDVNVHDQAFGPLSVVAMATANDI